MSEAKNRVFKSEAEARAAVTRPEREDVYEATDTRTGEVVYVAERSHPLARSAAARHFGIEVRVAGGGRILAPEEMVARMTPEQRAKLREMLDADPVASPPTNADGEEPPTGRRGRKSKKAE
jgi:hypothetical protein